MNIHCHFKQAINNTCRFLFLLPFLFLCFSASLFAQQQYLNIGTAVLKTSPSSGDGIAFDVELDSTYLTTDPNYAGLGFEFISTEITYEFQLVITFSGTGQLQFERACGGIVSLNASKNLYTVTLYAQYPGNPNQAPLCDDFLFRFNSKNGALDVCNITFSVLDICEE